MFLSSFYYLSGALLDEIFFIDLVCLRWNFQNPGNPLTDMGHLAEPTMFNF